MPRFSFMHCVLNLSESTTQQIPHIDDHSRSSYVAVTNMNGTAAMSHSNRGISLINMGSMTRVGQINGLNRTVWTLAYHPTEPELLATGDLGGRANVFRNAVNLNWILDFQALPSRHSC